MRRLGLSLLALALILEARSATSQSAAAPSRATCVFSNPAYAGKCVQNPDVARGSSPQQACESILACLNNNGCLKTYCDATTVRTGWKLVSAKAAGQGQ